VSLVDTPAKDAGGLTVTLSLTITEPVGGRFVSLLKPIQVAKMESRKLNPANRDEH